MARLCAHLSFITTARTPLDDKSNHDHAQAQQLISTVCAVLPSSGLTHFWDTAGQSSVVMPMTASDTKIALQMCNLELSIVP